MDKLKLDELAWALKRHVSDPENGLYAVVRRAFESADRGEIPRLDVLILARMYAQTTTGDLVSHKVRFEELSHPSTINWVEAAKRLGHFL